MLYIIAVATVAFFFLGLGSVFTAILVLNSSRIKDIGEKFQNMLVNLHW